MLEQISKSLCAMLLQKHIIHQRDAPIYKYGLELLLSATGTSLTILLLGILAGYPYCGFLYLSITVPLRLTAGGYHAQSYSKCYIVSISIFLLTLVASELSSVYIKQPFFWFVLLCMSCVTIWKLGPVRNIRHEISDLTYCRNRTYLHAIIITMTVISFPLYCLANNTALVAFCSLSVLSVAIQAVIPVVHQRQRGI